MNLCSISYPLGAYQHFVHALRIDLEIKHVWQIKIQVLLSYDYICYINLTLLYFSFHMALLDTDFGYGGTLMQSVYLEILDEIKENVSFLFNL